MGSLLFMLTHCERKDEYKIIIASAVKYGLESGVKA